MPMSRQSSYAFSQTSSVCEYSRAPSYPQQTRSSHAVRSVSVTPFHLPSSVAYQQQQQQRPQLQVKALLHAESAPLQMQRSISAESDVPGRVLLQRMHDQMSQSPNRPHAHKHSSPYKPVSPPSAARARLVTAAIPVEMLPPTILHHTCSSVPRHSARTGPAPLYPSAQPRAQVNAPAYQGPQNDYSIYAEPEGMPSRAICPSPLMISSKCASPQLTFASQLTSPAMCSHTSSVQSDFSFSSPDSGVCRHISMAAVSVSAVQPSRASESFSSVDGMTSEDWAGLVKSYRALRNKDE